MRRRQPKGLSAPVHHDDLAHPLPQPALDQQRHVHHDDLVAPPPRFENAPEDRACDGRVHDPVQNLALPFVVEDDAPELLPVDGAGPPVSLIRVDSRAGV